MFGGFPISIIKSAHNRINLWQFSNLVTRVHKLLCLFTSRQFPCNYKADDKHFIPTDCCSHILCPLFSKYTQLIADIALSLLHENSNFLCCCVLREDIYVPYRPVQDRCQNALKACWLARVKKHQGHSCTLLFPCVNLHVILFAGRVPNCYCIHFMYCMVWCLACKLRTASAGCHAEKVTYIYIT